MHVKGACLPQRIACLIFLVCVSGVQAQLLGPEPKPAPPRYIAHLLTFSPGGVVWERFGHNALFIHDRKTNESLCVDFGNFDFRESDFLWRFVFGEMLYWAEGKDPVDFISLYAGDNRQIWRQQLHLGDQRIEAMLADLRENLKDENKHYRYDYYRDNCSTRIRDVINRAAGGDLVRKQLESTTTPRTYRWHTRIGMEQHPFLFGGVEFSLAQDVDRPLNAWEESYLPAMLMEHLKRVKVPSADGSMVDLVGPAEEMNLQIDRNSFVTLPDRPPAMFGWYLAAGLIVGTVLVLTGFVRSASAFSQGLAGTLWGAWGLAAGLGGCFLLFLWLFTGHVSAHANENLLAASPLAIGLAVLGPLAAFGRLRRVALALAGLVLALALLGIVLKVLPAMRQDNWNILALVLPAHAGLVMAMAVRLRAPTVEEERVTR